MKIAGFRLVLAPFLIALIGATSSTFADEHPFTEQELRGKRIYVDGETESGRPVTAVVAKGGTPIPASILPCVGCHGNDGKGRPEGGVVPTDINWKYLIAAYGHEHSYGRKHPSFDAVSVARAVILGTDPAGNDLDVAMPRYEISEQDMSDLIAYLKRLEDDFDPGISNDLIRVGTLLPISGSQAGLGEAMRKVIEAQFAEINAAGGIHGRKLELVVADYGEQSQKSVWQARDLMQREKVFAMVSGYAFGVEEELAALAEELEIPVVGPRTQTPREGNGLERHSFYLTSGMEQQAVVLIRNSQGGSGKAAGRTAVIHPALSAYAPVMERVQAELQKLHADKPLMLGYQPPYVDVVDLVRTLSKRDIRNVLFLGTARDLQRLAEEATASAYEPVLMLPGVFAGAEMLEAGAAFGGEIRVAYPSIPADHTPQGVTEFEALHREHGFGFEYSTAQISAFVATKVFAEALKRSGRALSREKILAALEGLADYRSGLMPPISYNRSRRIGAFGAYVITLDLQKQGFGETSNWISLQL